jgi:hypothetical protein
LSIIHCWCSKRICLSFKSVVNYTLLMITDNLSEFLVCCQLYTVDDHREFVWVLSLLSIIHCWWSQRICLSFKSVVNYTQLMLIDKLSEFYVCCQLFTVDAHREFVWVLCLLSVIHCWCSLIICLSFKSVVSYTLLMLTESLSEF